MPNSPKHYQPLRRLPETTSPRVDTRPSSHLRGYDSDWERLRGWFIAKNPVCAKCGRPADVVDHIQPIRQAPELRLAVENLQSLCNRCHAVKTHKDKRNAIR